MLILIIHLLIFISSSASVLLKCLNVSNTHYKLENDINVEVNPLSKFGFGPSKSHAYDVNGVQRTTPHMWRSSNVDFYCTFRMHGYVISSDGKIFHSHSNDQVLFSDSTMCGAGGPMYTPQMFVDWNNFIKKESEMQKPVSYRKRDMVVPLRMAWDDCFNHMSFQVMPLVGAVLEFHGDLWEKLSWHASTYTAAMLNAMGVPWSAIIVEEPVEAKVLLLPWIPYWLPVQLASVRGISLRSSELFTRKLIAMEFPESKELLDPLPIYSPTHPNDTAEDLMNSHNSTDGYRYLVYMTRMGQDSRDVYNEKALLAMMAEMLDTSKVKLVVVGHSHAYKTAVMLQRSWQRFAKVFSKAIIMMGPHGGAWNNIMFTPSDCHYVEFNYLPDDPVYEPNTNQVRQPTLNAAWAKGGSGKFYNLEANNKTNRQTPPFLYVAGWMKLSIRDAARILVLINADVPNGGVLRPGADAFKYPHYLQSDLDVPCRKWSRRNDSGVKAKTVKAVAPNSQLPGNSSSAPPNQRKQGQTQRKKVIPKIRLENPPSLQTKRQQPQQQHQQQQHQQQHQQSQEERVQQKQLPVKIIERPRGSSGSGRMRVSGKPPPMSGELANNVIKDPVVHRVESMVRRYQPAEQVIQPSRRGHPYHANRVEPLRKPEIKMSTSNGVISSSKELISSS